MWTPLLEWVDEFAHMQRTMSYHYHPFTPKYNCLALSYIHLNIEYDYSYNLSFQWSFFISTGTYNQPKILELFLLKL